MTNEERIARMSPEKRAEFEAKLARAHWVSSLKRDDLRALMWKETQDKLGVTYDVFDDEIAALVLREETYRLMTMDARQAILAERDVRYALGERYGFDGFTRFNHASKVHIVHDSLVRLYGRGILFAAYDAFSNSPSHPKDVDLMKAYDERLYELAQMEANARLLPL